MDQVMSLELELGKAIQAAWKTMPANKAAPTRFSNLQPEEEAVLVAAVMKCFKDEGIELNDSDNALS